MSGSALFALGPAVAKQSSVTETHSRPICPGCACSGSSFVQPAGLVFRGTVLTMSSNRLVPLVNRQQSWSHTGFHTRSYKPRYFQCPQSDRRVQICRHSITLLHVACGQMNAFPNICNPGGRKIADLFARFVSLECGRPCCYVI
jgi:hypothetical protein